MGASNLFFVGKGGVGKSTSSALTALGLARRGREVLLVSMDPAHNQADIFERRLGDRPVKVAPGLRVVEVDQERWIRRYLEGVQKEIQRNYRYLTAFNLEGYFRVMRHSPGLEEHALMLAFQAVRERHGDVDHLVFDMAPTALSLKFFALPELSLVWVRHLLALRRQIVEKRELVTRIRLLDREVETDKVIRKLESTVEEYTGLRELFRDRVATRVHLVLNPDRLSLAESRRIAQELARLEVGVARLVVNKVAGGGGVEELRRAFPGIPASVLPVAGQPLIGLPALEAFLDGGGFDLTGD